jgi:hypothetical protein
MLITKLGTYEGNFLDGVKNGKGRMEIKKDGSVYKGDWLQGERHGNGMLGGGGRRREEGEGRRREQEGKRRERRRGEFNLILNFFPRHSA